MCGAVRGNVCQNRIRRSLRTLVRCVYGNCVSAFEILLHMHRAHTEIATDSTDSNVTENYFVSALSTSSHFMNSMMTYSAPARTSQRRTKATANGSVIACQAKRSEKVFASMSFIYGFAPSHLKGIGKWNLSFRCFGIIFEECWMQNAYAHVCASDVGNMLLFQSRKLFHRIPSLHGATHRRLGMQNVIIYSWSWWGAFGWMWIYAFSPVKCLDLVSGLICYLRCHT